jgi:hypothetical protein
MNVIKKMNPSLTKGSLSILEMQEINGGKLADVATCGGATGLLCTATVLFALSPLFCLAPCAGIGCALGLASCP